MKRGDKMTNKQNTAHNENLLEIHQGNNSVIITKDVIVIVSSEPDNIRFLNQ